MYIRLYPERERERERQVSSVSSLPDACNRQGWVTQEARNLELHLKSLWMAGSKHLNVEQGALI